MLDSKNLFQHILELESPIPLSDKSLLIKPITLNTQEAFSIKSAKIPIIFAVSLGAGLTVSLFNDEDDFDDLGIAGTKEGMNSYFSPSEQAILRYDLNVQPKINSSGSLKDWGLDIKIESGVRSTLYKRHLNTENLGQAISQDFNGLDRLINGDYLDALEVGDTICYSVEGKLKGSVEINWSNLLSKSIKPIASIFKNSESLDFDISSKFKASFELEINDHFAYVISRVGKNTYSVCINKIKNTSKNGGIGYAVQVNLKNTDGPGNCLELLLENGTKSIFKESPKFISDAIKHVKEGKTRKADETILERVADYFDLPDWEQGLDNLEEKWNDLKDDFKSKLKKIAESSAQLTVSYEFSKIQEGKELFKADFNSKVSLDKYHADFLKFDLTPLLAMFNSGNKDQVVISNYINQQSTTLKSSWGIGLNIGNLKLLESKDNRGSNEVIRRDIRGHQQVSISKSRGYNWTLGNKGSWLSQFDLTMPFFSNALEPTYSEFDMGWTFKFYEAGIKIKSQEMLRNLLDSGANWSCILSDDVDQLTDKYYNDLHKKKIVFQKQLYFSPQVLQKIFIQINQLQSSGGLKKLMSKALASSLKRQDGFPMRNTPEKREKAYRKIWEHLISHPNTPVNDMAAITAYKLREQSAESNLVERERSAGKSSGNVWLADIVKSYPHLIADLNSCMEGMQGIGLGITAGQPFNSSFDRAYRKIESFLGQSFYLEVLANFLLRVSLENPYTLEGIDKSIVISIGEEADNIIHIGGS